MWLLMIFWKSFRGMWRLVVGLIIGVVLYIVTFTNQNLVWIFNDVYTFSNFLVDWLSQQDWFDQYEKWNNLVKPGDRLPLIIYILVGRFIWLLIEEIIFVFPYWLMFGRQKKNSAVAGGPGGPSSQNTPPSSQKTPAAQAQMAMASVPTVPQARPAPIAGAVNGVASDKPVIGLDALDREAGDLERSIDEALERIKHVGEDNSNN
jgi:hypothetical protein